jgi:murein DD-endopeptidase MepM/ murein hydrolase activator NlpD
LFLLATVGSVAAEEGTERLDDVTQRLVQAIKAQDFASIREESSKTMLDAFPSHEPNELFTKLAQQFGKIERFESPRRTAPNQAVILARCALRNLEITVALDEHNKIAGLSFLPPAIPVPDKLVTSFRLPFEGQWLVSCDGNVHHHNSPLERFAFDFLAVDEGGRSHRGKGKENKDYYAFGRPVLAPADGIVTDVISGVRDNTPGSVNPSCASGNMIILRHREHEVSTLGHLQQGSIRVRPGEKVEQGQVLALCGNSGYSFQPHLHFHVQNTPVIPIATGLRCVFEKITVTRDGHSEWKTDYAPVKGDVVS